MDHSPPQPSCGEGPSCIQRPPPPNPKAGERLEVLRIANIHTAREWDRERTAITASQRFGRASILTDPLDLVTRFRHLRRSVAQWRAGVAERKRLRTARRTAIANKLFDVSKGAHRSLRFSTLLAFLEMSKERRRQHMARQAAKADRLLPISEMRLRKLRYRTLLGFRRRRLLRERMIELAALLERRNALPVLRECMRRMDRMCVFGRTLRARYARRAERETRAAILERTTLKRLTMMRWIDLREAAAAAKRLRRASLRQRCGDLEACVAALEEEKRALIHRANEAESEVRAMEVVYRQATNRAAGARETAAQTIQRCWRGYVDRKHYRTKLMHYQKLTHYACVIQRAWRRAKGRRMVRQLKDARHRGAKMFQRLWKRYFWRYIMPLRRSLEEERKVLILAENLARRELSRAYREVVIDVLAPAKSALSAGMVRTVSQWGVVLWRWHTEKILAELAGKGAADDDDDEEDVTVAVRADIPQARPALPVAAGAGAGAVAVVRQQAAWNSEGSPMHEDRAVSSPPGIPQGRPSCPNRWCCPPSGPYTLKSGWEKGAPAAGSGRAAALPPRPQTADGGQQTDWSVLPRASLPYARRRSSIMIDTSAAFDGRDATGTTGTIPPRSGSAPPGKASGQASPAQRRRFTRRVVPGSAGAQRSRVALRRGLGDRPPTCGSSRTPLVRGFRCELPPL